MEARPGVPIKCYAVSVFVCGSEDGTAKVLLLRRVGQRLDGLWCQVCGSIEAGETAWQAALREIREEAGLVPDRLYSADIIEQFYKLDDEFISLAPVFVAFLDSDQQVVLNHEHSQYRWATFREAEGLLPFPDQRAGLQHVEREFVLRAPNELLRIAVPTG